MEQGLQQPIENPFDKVYEDTLLGSSTFIEAHKYLLDTASKRCGVTLSEVLEIVAREFQTSTEELTRRGRHSHVAREVALWLGREAISGSLTDLATEFGISKSTVSSTIKQCEDRQSKSQDLREKCQRVKRALLEVEC